MLDADVFFLSVREQAELIRAREITPVELTEGYLERLERLGPRLNAVVTITRDRALDEARRAEREIAAGRYRGALHGIPYGAKDLLAARGYPTTWGAAPYRDQRFDYDSTVIERLTAAGAVLVAKLAMVELAGGMGYDQPEASFTGPGLNPWNTDFWSGGSSSGAGSAVPAGLVSFAIGSETWGSIVTPAAFSGVSGLRPTYGRVSRHGAMALCWTMDKLGPMCRTADDCGLVLAAIAGPDASDPSAADRPFDYVTNGGAGGAGSARGAPPFRVGVLAGAAEKVQPGVRRNYERALDVVESFARLEVVELPSFPYNVVARTVIDSEGATAFEDLVESGRVWELTAPADRIGGYPDTIVSARSYLKAMRMRGPMQRALDELFAPYDAIVAPTRATVAWPIGKKFREVYPGFRSTVPIGGASNAAGLPGISVPTGLGESDLPTAIQFVGRAFSEGRILAVARAYQGVTDWHKARPPVS